MPCTTTTHAADCKSGVGWSSRAHPVDLSRRQSSCPDQTSHEVLRVLARSQHPGDQGIKGVDHDAVLRVAGSRDAVQTFWAALQRIEFITITEAVEQAWTYRTKDAWWLTPAGCGRGEAAT